MTRGQQARVARAVIESALSSNGWQWLLRLSRWLDMLPTIEETI